MFPQFLALSLTLLDHTAKCATVKPNETKIQL